MFGYSALRRFTYKKWLAIPVFCGSILVTALLMILPFAKYNFGYWFNHGQAPHASRISITDILTEFLGGSQWIKFYLFLIVLLLVPRISKGWKSLQVMESW